ncbi:MAG: DUF4153 domain-containing protein [Tabrizicola sp.]|jgi:hypothetical protein|nr:DUF4153 domain-containing protein [Tabrizicola sp.]
MTGQLAIRWQLAATGALGAAILWAVIELVDGERLADLPGLLLAAAVCTMFAGTLAMAGPIGLSRAGVRAAGLGLTVAGLIWLALQRFATPDDFFNSPLPSLAALTVALLPVPFLIGQARGSWSDYGGLFQEAWSIVIRYAAAWAFTGVVWLVIFLSDQILQVVGITVIGRLLDHTLVPLVVTGAVLGLGMAVVYELADLLSPYLVLRLFRLLLPAVLVVMVIFLLALPMRGLDGLFSGLSPALLLLTMVGGGISLVAIAVDQNDQDAAQSPVIQRSAQAMALALPVASALSVWAVWLRVAQHGWTPERLFVALVALIGLGYAILYGIAVLRGLGWMERIRRVNLWMALGIIGLAALWLTPILNAEAISARDQLARYQSGRTPVADLDVYALTKWGQPGADALAQLETLAKEPGQDALAARLASPDGGVEVPTADLAAELADLLVVQPSGATGTRDVLLAAAQDYQLRDWRDRCRAGGVGSCLLVVADLLPTRPGEEAVLILGGDYTDILGLYLDDSGFLQQPGVTRADGSYVDSETAEELLRAWLVAPPPLTPALINQLGTGESGLMMRP